MDDTARVGVLLGRTPAGRFEVVVRDEGGDPVVIANDPLLDDGTPMPTRFWLVGPGEVAAVSRLEAVGGVGRAEREVDADAIADAHRRYAELRDALVPADHTGPRPSGGVGGTRTGVKCLHAHYAWHLVGGDDPVGRWVAGQLGGGEARTSDGLWIELAHDATVIDVPGESIALDGAGAIAAELDGDDPPASEALTNALGAVADRFEEVILAHPRLADTTDVVVGGEHARSIAKVEVGDEHISFPFVLTRAAAEDVFRTVATETAGDRSHNPGLPADHVDTIVAACCIVLAVMRRLDLDAVVVS